MNLAPFAVSRFDGSYFFAALLTGFLAAGFLAGAFFAQAFLQQHFFAAGFFAATFFAGAFLTATFLVAMMFDPFFVRSGVAAKGSIAYLNGKKFSARKFDIMLPNEHRQYRTS